MFFLSNLYLSQLVYCRISLSPFIQYNSPLFRHSIEFSQSLFFLFEIYAMKVNVFGSSIYAGFAYAWWDRVMRFWISFVFKNSISASFNSFRQFYFDQKVDFANLLLNYLARNLFLRNRSGVFCAEDWREEWNTRNTNG